MIGLYMNRIKKPFLKYLRPLDWEEVFGFWRGNEAHRSCAVALFAERKKKLKSVVLIALAKYSGDNLPVAGEFKKLR